MPQLVFPYVNTERQILSNALFRCKFSSEWCIRHTLLFSFKALTFSFEIRIFERIIPATKYQHNSGWGRGHNLEKKVRGENSTPPGVGEYYKCGKLFLAKAKVAIMIWRLPRPLAVQTFRYSRSRLYASSYGICGGQGQCQNMKFNGIAMLHANRYD